MAVERDVLVERERLLSAPAPVPPDTCPHAAGSFYVPRDAATTVRYCETCRSTLTMGPRCPAAVFPNGDYRQCLSLVDDQAGAPTCRRHANVRVPWTPYDPNVDRDTAFARRVDEVVRHLGARDPKGHVALYRVAEALGVTAASFTARVNELWADGLLPCSARTWVAAPSPIRLFRRSVGSV